MTRLFVCLLTLCAGISMVPPALAQDARAYTAPNICPVDPVAWATVELIAGAKDDRVIVERKDGMTPVTLAYDHAARSVTLTAQDAGSLRYTLQDDQHAAVSLTVTTADGKTVDALLAPELAFAYLTYDGSGMGKPVGDLPTHMFGTILAPGDLPDGPADTVRRLALSAGDDTGQCGATAAICTSRFNRMIGDGFLCALSLGGDQSACNGASDAKCAWCECKGYACQGCN